MRKLMAIIVFVFMLAYSRQIAAQSSTPSPTISPCSTTTTITFSPPSFTITPSQTVITAYDKIIISEVMVNPDSGQSEWVELYNGHEVSVHLSNWYLDDIVGGGASPRVLNADIASHDYIVIELTTSMFNNDADSVRLIDNQNIVQNSFDYSSSVQGYTLGRLDNSNTFCIQNPSKKSPNTGCIISGTPTTSPTESLTPTPTNHILPTIAGITSRKNSTLATSKQSLKFVPIKDVLASESQKVTEHQDITKNTVQEFDASGNANTNLLAVIPPVSSIVLACASIATITFKINTQLA